MKTITIGLLLPSSTIVPMGKDFERSLKKSLRENLGDPEIEIEVVSEFIGQGGLVKVEEAVSKLLAYDNADIITGIVSNKIGMEVAEKFERSKKPFLINNIGEHIPDPRSYNQYVFINSTHTWQQIWSLGYWAVKKFGSRGMFVGSVYDAGYAFTSMLKLGMEAADQECSMPFSIAPVPAGEKTADPRTVFRHIEEFKPDFILSVFCGEEAGIFQKEYITRNYHKEIPLLALPFLLQPFDAEGNELELYTTVASSAEVEPREIKLTELNTANPFSSLGSETGLILAEAINLMGSGSLLDALKKVKVHSSRGLLHIDSSSPAKNNKVYLVRNTYSGDVSAISMDLMEELETIDIDNKALSLWLDQPSSGWGNPYLGV